MESELSVSGARAVGEGGIRDVSFSARDGLHLRGTLFEADHPRAGVLLTSGTGFPARFYADFAKALAGLGFTTLCFDCRGIGLSKPESLNGFDMRYADWGRYDFPAALDTLRASLPGLPLLHVGHSVGGHFAGLMDNVELIQAHAFVCVGSGYWGHHHRWYLPSVMWFWHGWGRYSLARYGYLKRGGGWTGQDLPRGVFEDWRRWCHSPRYFHDELDGPLKPHRYAQLVAPIRSFLYRDDPIATARASAHILSVYPNAKVEVEISAAADHGLRRIGHSGPFPAAAAPARTPIFDWMADCLD